MFPIWKTLAPILFLLGVAGLFLAGEPGAGSRSLLSAAPVDNPRDPKPAEPILFPDGVIDPERTTAYVSSPQGGVQAIRLEDGKVLWTNDACTAQPWLVARRRLIARGDRLFVLDRKNDGKLLRQCDAPVFPKVEVPERCTLAFHLWGPRAVDDTLEAQWYGVANIDRSKGRPFNFQGWTAFNKAAPAGTVKIDLETGRATLQSDPKPVDVTGNLMPEAAKPGGQVPPGLPPRLADLWQQYHKDQYGRITMLGDRLVGVSMTLEPVGKDFLKKFALESWDLKTGTAADPVVLVKDKAGAVAHAGLTEDRRHVGVVFSTSALAIYSLADGRPVGNQVQGAHSPEKAFVEGKRLYHSQLMGGGAAQTPAALRAIDLESGKVVWERALKPRSTIPLPP